MPIYEYECDKCGVFEQSQSIKQPALTKCPTCRRKVRRLISNTSFQLKGSGWYVTDYARGGKNGEKSDSKSEAKSDSAGSESKSESKTESKADKTETKSSASSTATTAS
jgi:putative FmdB family regulatory protein